MKILAIRGCNLASLEGEFAVELAEGPLARAGVFAICGPTGAGKSTLLDAMCLALFDTAPRLDATSRVRIGRDDEDDSARLTTSDPRWILRRGAGKGFAEVDFLGIDGRRYRARWEVWRARGRAGGKLQATTMSLLDLDEDKLVAAGRKTDVKEAIEARLGLSFDQFRRSVLLAQGDFAAFLDADAKERAGLLERMTGTEIYGAISIEAHARAMQERRALEALEARAELVTVLSDEARAAHEEKARALEIALLQDERAARDAQKALAWHAQREALLREEAMAREEHEHIERQLAVWETRRQELAMYVAALPVQPWLEAADRAAETLKRRRAELDRAEEEREACALRLQEAERLHLAASAAAREAERALEQAAPLLARARVLDGEIETLRARLASVEAKRAAAGEGWAKARARVEALQAELARHVQQEREARTWLEAHAAFEPMARRWDRNGERLARLLELASEVAAAGERRHAAMVALADADERLRERERASAEAAEAASRAREAWERAAGELRRETSPEALSETRARWIERRSLLETMIGVAELAQRAYDAARRQRASAERAASAAASAAEEAARVERERAAARVRLSEARRSRDLLRATLDLAAHRAELREGEPCPLCGSTEHPFAREHPAVERLLDAQDERTREVEQEVTKLEARLADLLRSEAAYRDAARAAEEEASSWDRELENARSRYSAASHALGVEGAPWPSELPGAPPRVFVDWGPLFAAAAGEADGPLLDRKAYAALIEARDDALEVLAKLDAGERARRERERDVEALRALLDAAREEATRLASEAERAREACEERTREVARLSAEQSAREARLEEVAAELATELAPWSRWRERLREDAAALAHEVRRECEAWREHEEARGEAAAAIAATSQQLEAAREQEAHAASLVREAEAEVEEARASLAGKTRERMALLEGRSADEYERALRAAQEKARDDARRALDAATLAQRAQAESDARAARAAEAYEDAARDAERTGVALARELAAIGLDEAGARARLGRDRSEIEQWRAELERLDEARARQAAVLAERTRKREAHEATDPPALDADQAREAVREADRRSAVTRDLLLAERSRLARDDEQRASARALAEELEAQRSRLAVWETLADVVGSANGAKLRVFAQSLTLEILLEHANHHLRDLAPRYSLARVPGEDLALMVIDHEMGDEVRAVSSLSGGESFLVALGMALGLASLSSQRARVDSLFIDEGFGALDPASLDLVLSTLDALQATGKQVGLISHVPAIAERFATRVVVVPAGPARSRVELVEEGP